MGSVEHDELGSESMLLEGTEEVLRLAELMLFDIKEGCAAC